MVAVRRNLFPVNGGPGSMLATKLGKEEFGGRLGKGFCRLAAALAPPVRTAESVNGGLRSEEHTSELQSQFHLVCRLLLEKKNKKTKIYRTRRHNRSGEDNVAQVEG